MFQSTNFEILLSIIQYHKLQWMSTKLTSFKKLCTGLLKLSNVLLWYEMVKKNMKYCTKNNKHCYAYRVLLANTNRSFSFSLLTRSNTGFQIKKKRKKNFSKMVHLDAKKKINKYTWISHYKYKDAPWYFSPLDSQIFFG